MRSVLLLFTLFFSLHSLAQNEKILSKKGMIILEDNKHIPYLNVKLTNGNFRYTDEQGIEKELLMKEVMYIEDEQNAKIFTNKTVVERYKKNEEKRLEEEKTATAERNLKKQEERAKLEEERKLKLLPNGIYYTKEDFLNKNPNSTEIIVPKGLIGFEKPELNGIPDVCFFYSKNSDKKIKKVFAIAYEGHLYFQIQAILNNRNKTDRAQTNDFPNSFSRVLIAGENYYYLESDLVNLWVQGVAYNMGATGTFIAQDLSSANVKLGRTQNFGSKKGIVWDIKNKEFNIFKNCNDYNDFIKNLYPDGIQECDKHQPDILKVREAIEKIK